MGSYRCILRLPGGWSIARDGDGGSFTGPRAWTGDTVFDEAMEVYGDPMTVLPHCTDRALRAIVRTKETALELLDEVLHYPCRLELPQPARAGPAELWW